MKAPVRIPPEELPEALILGAGVPLTALALATGLPWELFLLGAFVWIPAVLDLLLRSTATGVARQRLPWRFPQASGAFASSTDVRALAVAAVVLVALGLMALVVALPIEGTLAAGGALAWPLFLYRLSIVRRMARGSGQAPAP